MWKSGEPGKGVRAALWRKWRWVFHFSVLFAGVALAKLNEPPLAPAKDARPALAAKAGASQHLRCWQYGRLILEEANLDLSAEAVSRAVKLNAAAPSRAPGYLLDMGTAMCFIRSAR